MKLVIDRFEEDFAIVVAEDGSAFNIPKKLLICCREGDVLKLEFDETETKNRAASIKNLMGELFE